MMKGIFLLLGTNLGNRTENIREAMKAVEKQIGKITGRSSLYLTEAWGYRNQPGFFNQVIQMETDLSPAALLARIHSIEKDMGRVRFEKWKERLIDIDILYYGNEVISTPNLEIPHPHLPNRRFTLIPLCELAPEKVHPVLKQTNAELLKVTNDHSSVKKI